MYLLFELTTSVARDAKGVDAPVTPTAEYTTAWGIARFIDIAALTTSQRHVIELKGGNVLYPRDIRPEATLQRRTGWRSIPKAVKGALPCQLMVSSAPVTALPKALCTHVGYMPMNIVCSVSSMQLLSMYRASLAEALQINTVTGMPQFKSE